MSISFKSVGTYIDLVSTGSVPLPSSPAAGDRMFLFVCNKDYSDTIGVSAGWTPIGSQYADGTSGSGSGSGSMSIHAWYRDWESGDSNPTVTPTPSASDGGAAVIILFEKGLGDTWDEPLTTNAAWTLNTAATPQTVSAVGSVAVPDGSAVLAFLGISDDVATITRPTSGIDVSSGITWDGDYVESPASHFSTTSGFDASADLGYRMVTTGGTVTLRLTATLATAETGSIKFVVQSVTSPASLVSQILRPIDGLEEDAANTTWEDIDDDVMQPATPGSLDYLEYAGTSITTYTEKWLVEPPDAGYTIRKATLWVLARAAQALPVMYMNTARAKLNGTWYELTPLSASNLSPVSVMWHQFEVTGISESTDSADIGFELTVYSSGAHVDQKAQIDAAYLELDYLEPSPAAGGFFAWW